MTDLINHPPHYNKSSVECIEFTSQLCFVYGNVIKYLYRVGDKDDRKQDLKKAQWYLDFFLEEMDILPLKRNIREHLKDRVDLYRSEINNPLLEQAVRYRCTLKVQDRKKLLAILEIELDGGKV